MAKIRAAAAAGWLLLTAATTATAAHHPRFQAMETGGQEALPGLLSPRYYQASPPTPMAKPVALEKRQTVCSASHHPCNDIGFAVCCSDDAVCIVNPSTTTAAACCSIGSNCGSPCSASEYYQCDSTATITTGGSTTTSLVAACCPRVCTSTSMFGCPDGGCCSYGFICGSNKACIATATSSSSVSPVVSAVPPGCTTSQIACASSLSGGCCAVTQSCTLVSGKAACAALTPTGSGITPVPSGDGGLSTGAKAGLAIGVVAIAGILIGAATWWWVRRRRQREQSEGSSSRRPRPNGVSGAVIGGGGRDMSEVQSDILTSPGGQLPGITQDYFGPDAAVGPYTETDHHNPSTGTSPGVDRDRGGVPLQPHDPNDFVVPVEIDSRIRERPPSIQHTPEQEAAQAVGRADGQPPPQPPQHHMATQGGTHAFGPYELHGSDLTPNQASPYTPSVSDAGRSHQGR
ncbi:hypothetical protein QBC46DRAFT_61453 [Diplogelasinospora grovesii]|uniref:Mid2 domain-containing protein n=1 Tax=Diplogelasinospora grovesii TaxID=303347 RepID=A0AAN6S9V9_9PEZI|nr:hypothetical protein QBC46DRAFT_61453 [Diplogelasinospora grovesii]